MCHNVFGNFLYMLQKTVVHCYRIMEQSMLLGQLLLAKMSICPSIKNSKKLHDADRQQEEGLDKR